MKTKFFKKSLETLSKTFQTLTIGFFIFYNNKGVKSCILILYKIWLSLRRLLIVKIFNSSSHNNNAKTNNIYNKIYFKKY